MTPPLLLNLVETVTVVRLAELPTNPLEDLPLLSSPDPKLTRLMLGSDFILVVSEIFLSLITKFATLFGLNIFDMLSLNILLSIISLLKSKFGFN